jgi:uroporphyrinogen decarboxylase
VSAAIGHQEPDRVPVDFLATPQVWDALIRHLELNQGMPTASGLTEPARERVLRALRVDCRVVSYDMFCQPPEGIFGDGVVDWWSSLSRSTPNRMWRRRNPDNMLNDIWGAQYHIVDSELGGYEELANCPLGAATSIAELAHHQWPDPDWWEWDSLVPLLKSWDQQQEFHVRYRIGSVFEQAWHLRGMQQFLLDLIEQPAIPLYILQRIADVHVENTRRVLELAGDRIDCVYFYDDVATKLSLMVSKKMWRDYVRPHHARLVDIAHGYGKPVMYHCDGAVYSLIPDLIELGIDVLSPVEPGASGMAPGLLKSEFGDRLAFHGAIDIVQTLPKGTREEVRSEVRTRVQTLGAGGGYILCSSHHIQPDTPVENILEMYDVRLR